MDDRVPGGTWDFFISYTQADLDWAEWVAWELQYAGYSVLLQTSDFIVGSDWALSVADAAEGSKRIIVLISEAYVSAHIAHEEEFARLLDATRSGSTSPLLPLLIKRTALPPVLSGIFYVDLTGLDEATAGQRLLDAASRSLRGTKREPPFPRGSRPAFSAKPPTSDPAPSAIDLQDRKGLDRAIRQLEDLSDSTGGEDVDRSRELMNLSTLLLARYQQNGDRSDLERAIRLAEQAVSRGATASDRTLLLANLSTLLHFSYQVLGNSHDLDRAIRAAQEAASLISWADADRSSLLSNLGAAFLSRSERSGQAEDLDRAIDAFQEAVRLAEPTDPNRAARLLNLSTALVGRHQRRHAPADLDEAIHLLRIAIDEMPLSSPSRVAAIANLGISLLLRANERGDRSSLDEAEGVLKLAINALPKKNPSRPVLVNALAQVKTLRRAGVGNV